MKKLSRFVTATAALTLALFTFAASPASAATSAQYWQSAHTYYFISWSPDAPDSCLDDSNTGPNGTDNLRAFTCNGQAWQNWTVIDYANGWAQLENQATKRCLDYSLGSGLRTFPCYQNSFNGGWQQWALVNRTTASGGAEQVLKSAINQENGANTCIDVSSAYGTVGLPCGGIRQDAGYQGWSVMDDTFG
ncbi:RICIN domain-containing protein [Kutzneria sp. CA-103260]|uniref:RICIN domain-containing protein n=1 Tax=Kutzneria sp. CA-103260 TaxID=2802641 RepID=UPI001BAA8F60|nr:RICIN domain-containing protein [Kutzneria sp. CA-103260]QUQ64481.1 Ricin-type beta-trefoil lectin domain-like protein [Kutzneria sp. CA-103260]